MVQGPTESKWGVNDSNLSSLSPGSGHSTIWLCSELSQEWAASAKIQRGKKMQKSTDRHQSPVSELGLETRRGSDIGSSYPEHPNLSGTNWKTKVDGVILSQKPTGANQKLEWEHHSSLQSFLSALGI